MSSTVDRGLTNRLRSSALPTAEAGEDGAAVVAAGRTVAGRGFGTMTGPGSDAVGAADGTGEGLQAATSPAAKSMIQSRRVQLTHGLP